MARLNFRWPFLLAVLSTLLATSADTDTMNSGDTVTDAKSLMSTGGGFRLGFFTPGNSRFRYLGIWYDTIPKQTVIWVANRERGINDATGVLSFHGNGSLVLSDARGDVYWSTAAAAGVASPVARLLDNANFVVITGSGAPAWQSFDYPTDSLMPGMKLSWDWGTGRNRNITSWRSPDDPAPGQYSIVMDTESFGSQIVLMQGATRLWTDFSGIPDMFSFSFDNVTDEKYFRFDSLNNTTLSRLMAQPTGMVELMVWVERTESWLLIWAAPDVLCGTIKACGPFGFCDANGSSHCSCLQGFERPQVLSFSDGCARRTALDCRNGTDGFVNVTVAKLPDMSAAVVNSTMGVAECRAECLKNCSCTAYVNLEVTGESAVCILWAGDLTGLRDYAREGQDLFVRVAAADLGPRLNPALTNGSELSTSKRVLLPVVGAVLATVVLGWICWFLWRRQRRRRKTTTERCYQPNQAFSVNYTLSDLEENKAIINAFI